MKQFLAERRCNSDFNFMSLSGGNYKIELRDNDRVFKLFTKTPQTELPYFVVQPNGRLGACYIVQDIQRAKVR